jgi:hypothetical protein
MKSLCPSGPSFPRRVRIHISCHVIGDRRWRQIYRFFHWILSAQVQHFRVGATTDVLGGSLSLVPPRTQLLVAHAEESDLRLSGLYLQVIVIDSSTRLDSGFYFFYRFSSRSPLGGLTSFGASPNLVCQERQTLNPVQKSRSDQRHNDISMGGSATANIDSVALLRMAKQSFLASPFSAEMGTTREEAGVPFHQV